MTQVLDAGRKPKLDIHGAYVPRTDLSSANLKHADLSGANATGAIFRESDFDGANLRGTILIGADLTGARNLTIDQLALAVLDASTRLPDYIQLDAVKARQREISDSGAMSR